MTQPIKNKTYAEVITLFGILTSIRISNPRNSNLIYSILHQIYTLIHSFIKEDKEKFNNRRKELVKPVFKKLKRWLLKKSNELPPETLLGKAVNYTLTQWPKLIRYIENSYLTPDTNLVENAIRPFVVGRKNWLFSGSPRGAYASASLYSLIETAKANKLEPYKYLCYILTEIPFCKNKEDFKQLLPQYLEKNNYNSFIF